MPDPDEALCGMMAIERMHGGAPSAFLWGQNYGFSYFEVEIAARAFALLGPSTAVLKASMLVPFSLGLVLLFLWVRRVHGTKAAWVAALLLLFAPPWFSWSLKARGGYVTAFVLAQLALLVATTRPKSDLARLGRLAAIGACAAMIALAQVLWLLPLLPFLWFSREAGAEPAPRRAMPWGVLFAIAGAVAGPLLVHWVAGSVQVWHAPDFQADVRPWETTSQLPERLFVFFTGRFLFGHALEASLVAKLTSAAWLALLCAGVALAVATRRGPGRATAATAIVAMLGTFAATALMSLVHLGPRYLLPVAECVALLGARAFDPAVASVASTAVPRIGRLTRGLAALALALGVAYAVDTHDAPQRSPIFELSSAERASLDGVVRDLEHAGVAHAYVLHGMLEWTLMFESKGRITARYVTLQDRHPEYAFAVDAARASGKRAALVGRDSDILQIKDLLRLFLEQRGIDPNRLIVRDDRWYYFLDPTPQLLKEAQFRLSK